MAQNPNQNLLNLPIPPDLDSCNLTDAKATGNIVRSNYNLLQTENDIEGITPDIGTNIQVIRLNSDLKTSLFQPRQGLQTITYTIPPASAIRVVPRAKQRRTYWITSLVNPNGYIPPQFAAENYVAFPSQSYAVGTNLSSDFTPDVPESFTMFLNITVNAGSTGTLTVNYQSKDSLSGNYVTTQSNLFTGANAVGTYRAQITAANFDKVGRLAAIVGTQVITFSIAGFFTPQNSNLAPMLYLGSGPDVTSTSGMPLYPLQYVKINPYDNLELWCFNSNATVSFVMSVTEFQ